MANNNVQAQETESLNIREAFFLKYKKAIIMYLRSQVHVRTRLALCLLRVRPTLLTRCMSRH